MIFIEDEEIVNKMRKKQTGKILPMPKNDSPFRLGSFNLSTHDIKLASASESDVSETLWHEQMHKELWEDIDIPLLSTYGWDNIAKEISEWLGLTHQHTVSWKQILDWSGDEKHKNVLYQPKTKELINLQMAKHLCRRD